MNKVASKLLKTILITAVLMYTGLTIFKQEVAFNRYDNEIEKYERIIEEEELKNEQLISTRKKNQSHTITKKWKQSKSLSTNG